MDNIGRERIYPMTKHLPPVNECLNCGIPLTTAFCPDCGQEAVQHTASVRELLAELVGSLFNLDSKFFGTLRALLFKPGMLTVAYNRGQRVRYLSPLRLYLVCSIGFFLLLAWKQSQSTAQSRPVPIKLEQQEKSPIAMTAGSTPAVSALAPDKHVPTAEQNGRSASAGRTPVKLAQINSGAIHSKSLDGLPNSVEEFKKQLKPGERVSPASLYVIRQAIKLRGIDRKQIIAAFLSNAPNMMFLLVPLFAVALKLLYVRSRTLYVEHLVFLLHAHAFIYIVLAALVLLPDNGFTDWAYLIVPVYIFLAMRTVYGQPWWKTIIKLAILAFGYGVILTVCLAATFFVIFLTI